MFSEIVRHGGGILAHVDEEVGAAQVSELGLGPEHGEGALAAFGKDGEVAGPSRGVSEPTLVHDGDVQGEAAAQALGAKLRRARCSARAQARRLGDGGEQHVTLGDVTTGVHRVVISVSRVRGAVHERPDL